jgi:hypothetical protein
MLRNWNLGLACLALCAVGCNLLLDARGYHAEAEAVDAETPDASNMDANTNPTVEASTARDACTAGTDRRTLENACTGATCVPFTTSMPSCDGGLCPLPATGPAEADAGATTSAVDGGSPLCTALRPDSSNIIFLTGSTALRGFIQEVSKAVATQPTNPITIVYQATASCTGVKSIVDPANNPLLPSLGAATYYDASGNAQTCALDPVNTVSADIGASDVFYSTCYMDQPITPPLPQSVSENFGPIQVMNFAVPEGSSQRSISLAAAYYVFGFGGNTYPIAPWTDPTELQVRSASSGTQSMLAAAIGVPAANWYGVSNASSGSVGTALIAAGQSGNSQTVDSALGILASDYLKQNQQTLRGLAIQDDNAGCAFYPSSTGTAADFVNVRDGHYPLWGPSHFYARISAQTQLPVKAGVSQFIDGLSGVAPVPGLDLIAEYASNGLVPQCAMSVSRKSDGADYSPSTAPVTCNCYFDLIATGATTCQACSTNADCPSATPNCNKFGAAPQQGYCDL